MASLAHSHRAIRKLYLQTNELRYAFERASRIKAEQPLGQRYETLAAQLKTVEREFKIALELAELPL